MLIEKKALPSKTTQSFKRKVKKRFKTLLYIANVIFLLFSILFGIYFIFPAVKTTIDGRIFQIRNLLTPKEQTVTFRSIWDITKYSILSRVSDRNVEKIIINSDFKNTNRFFTQLDLPQENNNTKVYSKGSLLSSEGSYDIKFRPKGDRAIHYRKKKPSFSIRVLNGKSMMGMERFSLQSPIIRNYLSEYLWIYLLKENGIVAPEYFFVNLFLNGDDLGIYSYEEKPTTFMLERLGLKNSSILKFDETYGTDVSSIPEIVVMNSDDVPLKNQMLASSILRGFMNGSSNVRETFDQEKLATFFAITDLCKTYHGLYAKSFRLYFNPYTNLLEPIPFDGHSGSDGPFISSELANISNVTGSSEHPNWIKLFFNETNDEFIDLYYEKLNYFSSEAFLKDLSSDEILSKRMDSAKRVIYKDFPLEQTAFFPYHFNYKEYLNTSSTFIQSKLQQDFNIQFYANIDSSSLSFEAHSYGDIDFSIEILGIESENFFHLVDKNLYFKGTDSIINLLKDEDFNDSLINDILINREIIINYVTFGGLTVSKKVNLFPYGYKTGGYSENYLEELLLSGDLRFADSILRFDNNLITIDHILTIPDSAKLVVNSGQKIVFKRGGGIISYGDIEFNGLQDSSIVVTYKKESGVEAYGGFIIGVGPSKTIISGVYFENLGSPDEIDITGSLTFYKSNVSISSTTFDNNGSEDFLNLVDCEFSLSDVSFLNCMSDCFDSDFSNGKLENVSFSISGNDGLDLSGSTIEANHLLFDHIGDKAISVGEESNLTIANVVMNSGEIGLACKDGSILSGSNIRIDSVRVPIVLFRKKERFDNPQISLIGYSSKNWETQYLVGNSLILKIDSAVIIGQSEDVESLLYGNMFGIKTLR